MLVPLLGMQINDMKAKNKITGEIVTIKKEVSEEDGIVIMLDRRKRVVHNGDFFIKFSDGHIGIVRKDKFKGLYEMIED